MRLFLLFGLSIIVASCTPDETMPLIKGYTIDWESDLGSRYAEYLPVPGKVSTFRFLHINADGSLIVLHSPISPQQWTATRVSPLGEFISEVTLPEEYISEISTDDQGNLVTLSSDYSSRIFRIWNSDLNVIQKESVPFPDRFTQVRLHKASYYLIDYYYNENLPVFTVGRYAFDGTPKWSRLLREYDADFSAPPLLFGERDELLFVRFALDSIQYSKVNGLTGDLIWGRRFPMSDFGKEQYYPFTSPLSNGKVLVVGEPDPGVQEDNWTIINHFGAIRYQARVNFPDAEVSRLSGVLEEEDGGYLITLGTDWQTSSASFKILKLDSHFNVGWVGTFNQLIPGYVAQMKRSQNHVIILTSNGYLYGLKRNL